MNFFQRNAFFRRKTCSKIISLNFNKKENVKSNKLIEIGTKVEALDKIFLSLNKIWGFQAMTNMRSEQKEAFRKSLEEWASSKV